MNPADLFQCSSLLKSLNSEMSEGDPEQIVVWPKPNASLSSDIAPIDLKYMESSCEASSILIDPNELSGSEIQIATLEKHGLLAEGFHDRVKLITVKLRDEIGELNADLSLNREVIQSLEEFQNVEAMWKRFDVDPLNSFSWNLSWWNAFQAHGDLHLVKFERAGKVVGLAPLYVDRWFGLTRLRFLATSDACTDYVDLICDPKHYELCSYSLAECIRESSFDVVELECTKNDRLAVLLKEHLVGRYNFDHRLAEPTWRLELPETWEQFVAGRKKTLRRKINKAIRRIESNEFTILNLSDLPFESAFSTFQDLHTRRMNSTGKPGVFADTDFASFLKSAVLKFHKNDKCEIVIAMQGDEPIASQLYFVSKDGFQFYQSGYAPEAMKLEPGHLLFTAMVRRAIELGDCCFDFLRGNEPYKEFWGAEPHSQKKLRMVSKRILPLLVANVVGTSRRLFRGN